MGKSLKLSPSRKVFGASEHAERRGLNLFLPRAMGRGFTVSPLFRLRSRYQVSDFATQELGIRFSIL
jgi:hypothetical protein